MKVLWVDTETSGLDHIKNDILTLAALAEIDGKIEGELELKIQPVQWENLETSALEVNGLTESQLKTFDTPKVAHKKLINFLEKFVFRYNKKDKFQPAGYNVPLDINFLASQFKKVNDPYFGAWVDYHKFDVATLVQALVLKGYLKLDNYRLVTVAEHFGVPLDAHDALNDIKATREIAYKILDRLSYETKEVLS